VRFKEFLPLVTGVNATALADAEVLAVGEERSVEVVGVEVYESVNACEADLEEAFANDGDCTAFPRSQGWWLTESDQWIRRFNPATRKQVDGSRLTVAVLADFRALAHIREPSPASLPGKGSGQDAA
jgi:hypothetical protein